MKLNDIVLKKCYKKRGEMRDKGLCRKYKRAFLRLLQGLIELVARFVFRLIYGERGGKMPPIRDLLLLESASSIALKIRTGKVTSVQVLDSFIERIKEVNPILNCVVANRFEDARKEAQAADDLIKSGKIAQDELAKTKPFLGVPFTTKDCIAVQGMIQTSGLYKRKDYHAPEDSDVVAAMRQAGAIPIALTNVSEVCMWWESSNYVHGRTNNPYDTNRIVGGSSGGEGCAQASASSAFGIGSDIGGSIRMPCFFNGVFGHKPSKFVISNKGQFPSAITDEQKGMLGTGPICRRAEDLLPLFRILTQKKASELRLDEKVDIKNVKFYYQDNDGGNAVVSPVSAEIKQLFQKFKTHLDKAHKVKMEKVEFNRFAKSTVMWLAGMATKSGPTFQQQLADLDGSINLWFEFVKSIFRVSRHTFVALGTALTENSRFKVGSEKHVYLLEQRDKLRAELKDILGDDGVFLYPTHPTGAPYHNEPIFKAFNFSYTGVINVLGFPATHCPMGLNSENLPIGIQVIANDNNDRLCLAVAQEIEKAFGGWVPPAIEA